MGAFGKFLKEGALDSIIFTMITALWNKFAKPISAKVGQQAGQKVGDIIEKTILGSAGYADESSFIHLFSRAKHFAAKSKIGFSTTQGQQVDKWKLFSNTMVGMEKKDKIGDTHVIRDFRIIIASDPFGKTCKIDKDGNTIPDPDYVHPGILTLQDMVSSCETKEDFRTIITFTAALQEAPLISKQEFKEWMSINIPKISAELKKIPTATKKEISKVALKLEKRSKEYNKKAEWEKWLLN